MNRPFRSLSMTVLVTAVALSASGCAGARLNKGAESKPLKPAERIAQLESEVKAKDQEIVRLQTEMSSMRDRSTVIEDAYAYEPATNVKTASSTAALRVPGVTVQQLQRALQSAGYEPGPIDGRLGRRTKEAVRSFQRAEGLKVDGVVGQKTWTALKAAGE
jgi:peptidoglycan hydrolase-like protein with peptidoglycan-binding domain